MNDIGRNLLLVGHPKDLGEALIPLLHKHAIAFKQEFTKKAATAHLLENPFLYQAIMLAPNVLKMRSAPFIPLNFIVHLKTLPLIVLIKENELESIHQAFKLGGHFCIPINQISPLAITIIEQAFKSFLNYLSLPYSSDCAPFLSPLPLLNSATFHFRSFNEGRELAHLLSLACPNPRLAIVGLSEIFINAVEHGNLGISYKEKTQLHQQFNWLSVIDKKLNEPAHKHKFVIVLFERMENELMIEVRDMGKGFDWKSFLRISPNKILDNHGRGIAMAKTLVFDRLEYNDLGNVVRCYIMC